MWALAFFVFDRLAIFALSTSTSQKVLGQYQLAAVEKVFAEVFIWQNFLDMHFVGDNHTCMLLAVGTIQVCIPFAEGKGSHFVEKGVVHQQMKERNSAPDASPLYQALRQHSETILG
jgi:hypothetical protein